MVSYSGIYPANVEVFTVVADYNVGIFGHIFDQKRQKQPLYRTPYDEIAYMTDL